MLLLYAKGQDLRNYNKFYFIIKYYGFFFTMDLQHPKPNSLSIIEIRDSGYSDLLIKVCILLLQNKQVIMDNIT
jgi:hypothetical protein